MGMIYDRNSEQSEIEDNVSHESVSSDSETEIRYWGRNNSEIKDII